MTKTRFNYRKVAAGVIGLAAFVSGSEAFAQASPTQITQTGTMLNAATTGATAGTIATNAQITATIAANGSLFFYVTALSADACTDTTGAQYGPLVFTTTNLPGTPVFLASGGATIGPGGPCTYIRESFSTPLKSLIPGTAVTFYSPTGTSHVSFVTRIYGYYGF